VEGWAGVENPKEYFVDVVNVEAEYVGTVA